MTISLTTTSELVPASARSTSSSAAPLAPQFVPVLSDTLEQVKEVIAKVLPVTKKLNALEEAEWEEESEEGALERELLSQCRFCCFFLLLNATTLTILLSDGDATYLPPTSDYAWADWNGAELCRCRCTPPLGRISRSKSGIRCINERLDTGSSCFTLSMR